MNIGFLMARVILGVAMSAHGAQKLFGWFGGYGPRGTGQFFEGLGFRPGVAFAVAAGLGELAGGLLTAAGLFGAVGPALIVTVMVVAMGTVHWVHGFFAQNNGIELPLVYAVGAAAIAFAGDLTYTIDRLVGITALSEPVATGILIGGAALAGVLMVVSRHVVAQPAHGRA